jgi:hypothetical protein
MIRLFITSLKFFTAFFHSRYSLGLEIVSLRQQLGVLKRKNPRPRLRIWIEHFGFCFAGSGPLGTTSLSSSNRKPSLPGIELAFDCSGAFDHGHGGWASRRSVPRFAPSFGGWWKKTQRGAHQEFMASLLNSVLMSRSVPYLAISGDCLPATKPAGSGPLSCAITARSSRLWTFSQCQLSPSESCIASSSSSTVDAGSSIST